MLEQVFTNWWWAWIGLFFVIEGVAITNKKRGDTLSEHVWKFLGVNGWKVPSYPWLRRGAFSGLFIWLGGHFFFGLW